MPSPEILMVASTIEPVTSGNVVSSIPAHMTIYPWFELASTNWLDFDDGMRDVIEQTRAPRIQGGNHAFYGENQDIAVRRLDVATRTFNIINGFDIHAGVYRLVNVLGVPLDDTYTGLHWAPHVSDSANFRLEKDQEVQLSNLTLFRRLNARQKLIKSVYTWSVE